jgi:putative phosphoesterase
MRILVISDVHSNWTALQAIDQDFDRCLFIGDLVDYGTDPLPCIEWVRRHADATVRGNHDHAVAQRVPATGTTGFRRLAAATRPLHWERLDSRILKYLGRLPVTAHYRADDRNFLLVHATPRDPMDEYLTANADAWRQRLQGITADFVLVGHTHVPFHLDLEGMQVVNPGSVGQPRDGDPRASYAIIEDGEVSFHRVSYDIDACLEQMRSTGVDEWAVRLSEAVLTTGGRLTRDEMDAIA